MQLFWLCWFIGRAVIQNALLQMIQCIDIVRLLCAIMRTDRIIPPRTRIVSCLLSSCILICSLWYVSCSRSLQNFATENANRVRQSHFKELTDLAERSEPLEARFHDNTVSLKTNKNFNSYTQFRRYKGEDVTFRCVIPRSYARNVKWSKTNNSNFLLPSRHYQMDLVYDGDRAIAQLDAINITESHFGLYQCSVELSVSVLNGAIHLPVVIGIGTFILEEVAPKLVRLQVPPGGILAFDLTYHSVESTNGGEVTLNYKINNVPGGELGESQKGCSNVVLLISAMKAVIWNEDDTFPEFANVCGSIEYVFNPVHLEDRPPLHDLNRQTRHGLWFKSCLSKDRFGVYTFNIERTVYNETSRIHEIVVIGHPLTLSVEPQIPLSESENETITVTSTISISTIRTHAMLFQKNIVPELSTHLLDSENNKVVFAMLAVLTACALYFYVIDKLVFKFVSSMRPTDWNLPTASTLLDFSCPNFATVLERYRVHELTTLFIVLENLQFDTALVFGLSFSIAYFLEMVSVVRTTSKWNIRCTSPPRSTTSTDHVFVLYADENRGWFMENVLPIFEKLALPVCCIDRDLLPGRQELEGTVTAIYNSTKFVVLVTPEFVESNSSRYYFNAILQRIFDGGLSIDDVFLLQVGDCDVHNWLRENLKDNYFDWDNVIFRSDTLRMRLNKWALPMIN